VHDAASSGSGSAGGTRQIGGGRSNDGAVTCTAAKLRGHDEVAGVDDEVSWMGGR